YPAADLLNRVVGQPGREMYAPKPVRVAVLPARKAVVPIIGGRDRVVLPGAQVRNGERRPARRERRSILLHRHVEAGQNEGGIVQRGAANGHRRTADAGSLRRLARRATTASQSQEVVLDAAAAGKCRNQRCRQIPHPDPRGRGEKSYVPYTVA